MYSELAHTKLSKCIFDTSNPELMYNLLSKTLLECVSETNISFKCARVQHTHHRVKKKLSLPWWNNVCIQAVSDRKDVYIHFKQNPTEQNYILFKRKQAQTKLKIKQERQNAWHG